jgi:dolichyl-phosphate-mannose--protein O-mannosyl transferase
MKNLTIALVVFMSLFSGCKEDPKLYPESSKLEGINATWVLTKVSQIDPTNKEEILDVSFVFTEGEPIELTINSTDFTYQFNNGNPLYMGNSGTWAFDDNNYPTKIKIIHDLKSEEVKLLRSIRTVDQTLSIALDRSCDGGTITTTYQYEFKRK